MILSLIACLHRNWLLFEPKDVFKHSYDSTHTTTCQFDVPFAIPAPYDVHMTSYSDASFVLPSAAGIGRMQKRTWAHRPAGARAVRMSSR